MVFAKSLIEYRKVWALRAKKMRQAGIDSSGKASKLMIAEAKRLAPRKTGRLIKGIRRRKKKQGWEVESWVSGSFKYNFWINQQAPYRTVNMRWNEFKPTVYGDGTHRSTGTPRFFHFATLKARKDYLKLSKINTRKALKVGLV
jgi:hypothetical protein|tara:strand:+ start:16605 stop:17036 length:432 start_codon:yes stop_codon:yes gene_type:complete